MKRTFRFGASHHFLLLAILLASLSLVSCEETPTSTTDNGTVSGTIEGSAWNPTTINAVVQSGALSITATETKNSLTRQVSIGIANAAVGSYDLSGDALAKGWVISYFEDQKTYSSNSGTVVISELTDSTAKGTFNATLQHDQGSQSDTTTRRITNGTFNVKL